MIDNLLYLTASRPYIMFNVRLCARFQTSPKESHFHAVKRITRHIKGTSSFGLFYPRHASFDLIRFSDVDFSESRVYRKAPVALTNFWDMPLFLV